MHLGIVEQARRAHEANRREHDQRHAAEYQHQPIVTTDAPRELRELRSTQLIADGGPCNREQEQVEFLDHESEGDDGDAGAHPGEECALIRCVIAEAIDLGLHLLINWPAVNWPGEAISDRMRAA